MDHEWSDELRMLRARAYGPAADILDDPDALARLRELEDRAQTPTPASTAADAVPEPVATDADPVPAATDPAPGHAATEAAPVAAASVPEASATTAVARAISGMLGASPPPRNLPAPSVCVPMMSGLSTMM